MMRMMLAAGMLLLGTSAAAQPLPASEAAIKAHVAFLASDALRGREAGTADYDVAAEYVAAQMLAAGLAPAGDAGSFFQKVPLVVSKPAAEPVMALAAKGATVPMQFGTDFTLRSVPGAAVVEVSAPLVFAGYGVIDKAVGRDDYRGLNVKGKIVAVLYSGPKGLPGDVAAHLGNRGDRAITAAAKGAVGIVYLETDQIAQVYPFAAMAKNWASRAVTWADAAGTPRPSGAPGLGIISQTGAEKLFAGAKLRWADVFAADKAGQRVPTGPLAVSLSTTQRFTIERLTSANVVGKLAGSDPTLAAEHVVLTGHLDHIGVTDPVNGDAINNGALDNALGIAAMLEVAKSFQSAPVRPKRSLLFVAVTAEEKGLIGSDYFATYPSVPRPSLVAEVNLDMPILLYRFTDVVAFGAERSSMGPVVTAAVEGAGFALVPDPTPEQASFTRSDHYSFVRQGIPSVSLVTGPGNGGAAASAAFRKTNYHQPGDEIDQPIDWSAAKSFVDVNAAIARALADQPSAPVWNKGDYFGTRFKGRSVK